MDLTLAILRDPYIQVTYLFVTGVAALYCLIGLWSAASRHHWFLRAIVPCLALAALIPIRAHEPLIFYAMIMAVIVVAVSLWRWWRGNVGLVSNLSNKSVHSEQVENLSCAGRFRFGLRDLFLLMIIAGIIAWAIAGFSAVGLVMDWPGAIAASVLVAALTLAVWNAVTSAQRRLAIGLLLATLISVVAIDYWLLDDWIKLGVYFGTQKSSPYLVRRGVVLSLLYTEFTVWLLIAIGLSRVALAPQRRGRQVAAAVALTAITVAVVVPLGRLYWMMTGIPDMPQLPRYVENVYPHVLTVGSPMESAPTAQADAIYQKLVPLLDRTGYVPLNLSNVRYPPGQDVIVRAQQLRSIGRAIDARGKLLASKGDYDQAAECSISMLKICRMQARGGLSVDTLVSEAVEGVGRHHLLTNRKKLSLDTRRKVMQLLADLDSQREPTSEVLKRETAYSSRVMRWRYALEQIAWQADDLETLQTVGSMEHRQQVHRRLLYTDLAIQLFQEDRGRLPQTLDELVPEYLSAVPMDPYSERPLVYGLNAEGFVLYSVGPDRIDDGGKPKATGQSINSSGIDWDLDSLVAP